MGRRDDLRHESTQAEALIDGFTFEKILADHGSEAVIPPHQRAKVKHEHDTWVYRERHLIECCFDKLDRSFLGFVQFACALVWLR